MAEKINRWGVVDPEQIINEIVSFSGLFAKIFGELLPPLVYTRSVEHNVHLLQNVYGFRDAKKIFPKVLDREAFTRISKDVFRIIEQKQQ